MTIDAKTCLGADGRAGRLPRLLAGAALVVVVGVAAAEPWYVDAGQAASDWFEVDLRSVHRVGAEWRFWQRSWGSGYYATFRMTEVGVDCARRTRAEYRTTTITRSSVDDADDDAPSVRRVFEGTRQAEELDLVCNFAASGGRATDARHVLAPQPAAELPASPVRRVVAGLVVSGDGVVVTGFDALKDCEALSVDADGTSRPAATWNHEPMNGLQVLKVGGRLASPWWPRPSLTLQGTEAWATAWPPDRLGSPARPSASRVEVVPGEDAESSPFSIRLSPPGDWPVAVLHDPFARVFGLLLSDGSGTPAEPKGDLVWAHAIHRVLWYHGIDWFPAAEPPGLVTSEAAAAVVRVRCHGAP